MFCFQAHIRDMYCKVLCISVSTYSSTSHRRALSIMFIIDMYLSLFCSTNSHERFENEMNERYLWLKSAAGGFPFYFSNTIIRSLYVAIKVVTLETNIIIFL